MAAALAHPPFLFLADTVWEMDRAWDHILLSSLCCDKAK